MQSLPVDGLHGMKGRTQNNAFDDKPMDWMLSVRRNFSGTPVQKGLTIGRLLSRIPIRCNPRAAESYGGERRRLPKPISLYCYFRFVRAAPGQVPFVNVLPPWTSKAFDPRLAF